MKKIFTFSLLFAFLLVVGGLFAWANSARAESSCDNHVVISQIYGGGGNSGAIYKNDFIELYNPTTENVSINNWSVQYVSATGNFPTTSSKITLLQGNIKSKSYYLIQEYSASNAGQSLENPDAFGLINFAADKGKVALVNGTALINSESASPVADFMIYSSGSNTTSVYRKMDSCPNTFSADVPMPRNSSIIESIEEEPQGNDDAAQNESENNDTSSQDSMEKCATSSKDIKLNELFPYPETSGQEFVELKNFGAYCVDLSGWKIIDEKENKYVFAPGTIIEPGEFWHADGNFSLNNTTAETVYLLDSSRKEVDKTSYEKAVKKYSFSSDGQEFFWTSVPTPGAENIFNATEDNKEDNNSGIDSEAAEVLADENVYLNEILPNPKDGSDDEYIEIANGESGSVDLFGWRIKDASKGKGYQFKEHIVLSSGEYFAIYRPDSKIALNNSDESVYLLNPKGAIVSSATFDKSPKNASFNFNGKAWKWSKYLTPGKKNKFDLEPSVKIEKPKNVFKDTFAEFSAKAKDKETKKLKYAWDFGDGKKSYLKKTSHKYLDTGKYTLTLSVSDDSQAVEKSFVLTVKNYPRPDLEIIKIIPNPAGNDAEKEIVEIKNGSGKKMDLAGWKIATGSGEKIYNHPISDEISLEANETKTIPREMCKFSLNNKSGKIQLVMSDGKVIDEVEYQKEKIAEDEAYAKIDGKWQWISPPEKKKGGDKKETAENPEKSEEGEGAVAGASDTKYFNGNSFDYGLLQENSILVLTKYSLPIDDIQSTQTGCFAKNLPAILFPFVTWNPQSLNTSPLVSAF